jgi:hypothetical protein
MRAPLKSLLAATGLFALACNSMTNDQVLPGVPLPAPASLSSVSLNGAIELYWPDNAFTSAPTRFEVYSVYSASYDLDAGLCGTQWDVEGTTVAPEFLVGALTNGVPRCYGVSAFSTDGAESNRSPLLQDTPRPDARNVLVYAFGTKPDSSGFRFWDDLNNDGIGQASELGLMEPGDAADIDFVIHRHNADSSLWIVPVYSQTTMRPYGKVADLTSIDFAPATGYSRDSLQAQVGYGYVFQMVDGPDLHYGAVRVSHVGRQYVILDWSLQTDPGNPELALRGGLLTAKQSGSVVAPAR